VKRIVIAVFVCVALPACGSSAKAPAPVAQPPASAVASTTSTPGTVSAVCNATAEAANTAATVHFARTASYPTTFTEMTDATPPELVVAPAFSARTRR